MRFWVSSVCVCVCVGGGGAAGAIGKGGEVGWGSGGVFSHILM